MTTGFWSMSYRQFSNALSSTRVPDADSTLDGDVNFDTYQRRTLTSKARRS